MRVSNWLFAFFLVLGVSLHAADDTPRKILSRAIYAGDLAQVQSLINSFMVGIDDLSEDYDPKSPLIEAASKANIPIMMYLIEKGSCIEGASENGYTPLVKFIEAGSRVSYQQLVEMVRFLIDSGADVNGAQKNGYTPLMAACQHTRCLELVDLLLDMGAFIDARAKDENTAYFLALRNNNVKTYRLLVSRGANVNMDWKGMRTLSMLAWEGNIVMAKMLIDEAKVNVNSYDPHGTTPVICATVGGQSAMVQFLVERGADINARTTSAIEIEVKKTTFSLFKSYVVFPKGSTALNFAQTMGNNGVANLIEDLGGILYKPVEYVEKTHW